MDVRLEFNREASMTDRQGQCLCGDVQYRISGEPVITRICWCRDCQHLAGNGTVNVIVPAAALQITGETHAFTSAADSGNQIRRRFCPRCGSHLFSDSTARAHLVVVRAGTLDDPSSVTPAVNIWAGSAPAWACLDPTMERVEGQPTAPPTAGQPAAPTA